MISGSGITLKVEKDSKVSVTKIREDVKTDEKTKNKKKKDKIRG